MLNVKLDGLTRLFGSEPVVNAINIEIRANTIHGILGPNGAGKTTTLKMICGLLPMSSGQILFNGEKIDPESLSYRSLFGSLIDEPRLYEDMSVKAFLSYIATLYALPKERKAEALSSCMSKLKLEDISHKLIAHLSKGYRQRVAIAAAIIHSPSLLILDEPTVGLDVEARAEMRKLIQDLKSEHTIIVSSHIMHEMQEICDDVTLLNKGSVVLSDSLKNILSAEDNSVFLKLKLESSSREEIMKKLQSLDLDLKELPHYNASLEQVFLEKIKSQREL